MSQPSLLTRVCTIIHLCLTFALLIWNASYPFSGEIFTIKMRKSLYQNVMGIGPSTIDHAGKFQNLPEENQIKIKKDYDRLLQLGNRSFLSKIADGISFLAFAPSPFERAWIFFSLILSFLILFNYPAAYKAVWLLPVITLCFAFDNYQNGDRNVSSSLFPTEDYLIEKYVGRALGPTLKEQFEDLRVGWEKYLITEWAGEIPSGNSEERQLQKSSGEFAFNLKRISQLPPLDASYFKKQFNKKHQNATLALYFLWNTLFALSCLRKQRSLVPCNPI